MLLVSGGYNGISINPEVMTIAKKTILILSTLLSVYSLRAQQFSYTATCDSSGTYEELNAQTLLNPGGEVWSFRYRIPIGFAFSFLGQSFDSVTVERNGYLSFDSDRRYAIMAFNTFHDKTDSMNNRSTLSYALSGTAGSRVLKLQFKNVGQTHDASEALSYQLWMKESGAVEIHLGPHTYAVADTSNYSDTLMAVQLGLLNTQMDTPVRGLFLGGSPTQPASQPVDDQHPDMVFMRSLGRAGTKYSFIPQQ